MAGGKIPAVVADGLRDFKGAGSYQMISGMPMGSETPWQRKEVIGGATLYLGDNREIVLTLEDNSVDSIVVDPPYHLVQLSRGGSAQPGDMNTPRGRCGPSKKRGFMGKEWDGGNIAFRPETWIKSLRVAKPGAHLLAFGGTRTYHRLVCAIEDAGWEIRDCILWITGQGLPKSLGIGKAIDRAAGVEREKLGVAATTRSNTDVDNQVLNWGGHGKGKIHHETAPATEAAKQWDGWGTGIKPAVELICLARKPLSEKTVAANILKHGIGGLNIDGCRVDTADNLMGGAYSGGKRPTSAMGLTGEAGGKSSILEQGTERLSPESFKQPKGRFPSNLILSYPEDEYELCDNVTSDQLRKLAEWMDENA